MQRLLNGAKLAETLIERRDQLKSEQSLNAGL